MTPSPPAPDPGDVHVWRMPLDPLDAALSDLGAVLSKEETRKAARLATAERRRRFVARRGWRRVILGRYLGVAPAVLEFLEGPRGKPEIAQSGITLGFNASHSGGLGLLAVTVGRPVGVDVEEVRPIEGLDGLIARFLPEGDREALAGLSGPAKVEAFFRFWTRHEARVKALGTGLSGPDDFLVGSGEGTSWFLEDFTPAPGFAAAVAVEGAIARLLVLDAGGLDV